MVQGNNFVVRDEGREETVKKGKLRDMNIPDSKITSALDTKSGKVFLFHNDRFWSLKQQPDGSLMVLPVFYKLIRDTFAYSPKRVTAMIARPYC